MRFMMLCKDKCSGKKEVLAPFTYRSCRFKTRRGQSYMIYMRQALYRPCKCYCITPGKDDSKLFQNGENGDGQNDCRYK